MFLDQIRRLARSRFAPLLVIGIVLVFGLRTCDKESAHVDLVFDFGAGAARVRTLHADVYRGDQVASVAFYDADFTHGGVGRPWSLQLDPGHYRLEMVVTTATGTRRVQRTIEATDRARITVALEADVLADPPGP